MNDRDAHPSDVLADEHVQEGDVTGDQLGGGLGNTAAGGADDG